MKGPKFLGISFYLPRICLLLSLYLLLTLVFELLRVKVTLQTHRVSTVLFKAWVRKTFPFPFPLLFLLLVDSGTVHAFNKDIFSMKFPSIILFKIKNHFMNFINTLTFYMLYCSN